MQRTKSRPDRSRSQHPAPQPGTVVGGEPASESAGHHDALDTQVQHPGALAQQHPQRAQDQRRRGAQHRSPERCSEQQVEHITHRQDLSKRMRYCVSSVAISIVTRLTATITSAM